MPSMFFVRFGMGSPHPQYHHMKEGGFVNILRRHGFPNAMSVHLAYLETINRLNIQKKNKFLANERVK